MAAKTVVQKALDQQLRQTDHYIKSSSLVPKYLLTPTAQAITTAKSGIIPDTEIVFSKASLEPLQHDLTPQPPAALNFVGLAANSSRDSFTSPPVEKPRNDATSNLHAEAERPLTLSDPPAISSKPPLPKKRPLHHYTLPARLQLRESKVPSSRFERLLGYGSIATSVATGVLFEASKRLVGSSLNTGSYVMTERNVSSLVSGLSRMRGAALKLGQMLSIQDEKVLPPELESILSKVQNSANYMPNSQLEIIMTQAMGKDWESNFSTFNRIPIAAASLGQVHEAVLAKNGQKVAVKVQYPGVASSIDSDLDNLKTLITLSSVLPKGLFLENTIRIAREELKLECDYTREAAYMQRFADLVKATPLLDEAFNVPQPVLELSSRQVLVSDLIQGVPIGRVSELDQETKDFVGSAMLRLSMAELFEWRMMQTDPNYSNFLYDQSLGKVNLIDFGATKEFPEAFTSAYLDLLVAASVKDRKKCIELSKDLKFLTGLESEALLHAHVSSLICLAEPLSPDNKIFDFAKQDATEQVRAHIPIMLKERLTPPPQESYSIHRKLSGIFLLCAKLGAKIECSSIFQHYQKAL